MFYSLLLATSSFLLTFGLYWGNQDGNGNGEIAFVIAGLIGLIVAASLLIGVIFYKIISYKSVKKENKITKENDNNKSASNTYR